VFGYFRRRAWFVRGLSRGQAGAGVTVQQDFTVRQIGPATLQNKNTCADRMNLS